jgi:ribosomal protein S2
MANVLAPKEHDMQVSQLSSISNFSVLFRFQFCGFSIGGSHFCLVLFFDSQSMLAAGVHLGTKNVTNQMEQYVFKRRTDGTFNSLFFFLNPPHPSTQFWSNRFPGVNLINLGSTWEKLMLAARIIVAVENPADVVVVSGRPYGQRACYKFGQYTGSNFLSGRFTPGTFTNQVNKKFLEPRVIIVTDPRTDYQVLHCNHFEFFCDHVGIR